MLIDTHCHLNFSRFKKNVDEVVDRAQKAGVGQIVIPGTDVPTSQKAVTIASSFKNTYAAVGIHPHHVFEMMERNVSDTNNIMSEIEKLLRHKRVVAIGEVGMDKHIYKETKYARYMIDDQFITKQADIFRQQIELAIRYKKSLIVHNREAKEDVTGILRELWDPFLEGRTVFHCCEPDDELLTFAKKHKIYLGVDGDITYWKEKLEFIKTVPLDMLVLETDSPFLLPEPLRTKKMFPNEPKNISLIAHTVAQAKGIDPKMVEDQTTKNAKQLFSLPEEE